MTTKNSSTKIGDFSYKIDQKIMDNSFIPQVTILINVFSQSGFEIRVVGGAVRDVLLGRVPKDYDLATNATPDQIGCVCSNNQIHCVETGLKHGTLTAVIDKMNFEITTLRNDVITDGRHAVVEWTKDWKIDAERRDLTINAMSLSLDGVLYDYFKGLDDLYSARIRFVKDPRMRIKEDFLRILRYFRFYGKVADVPPSSKSFDPEVLSIISEEAPNLECIAVERKWAEISQIFTGNFAPQIVRIMHDLNIFPYCGLEKVSNNNLDMFSQSWNYSRSRSFDDVPQVLAAALLSSFFKTSEEAIEVCTKLKLSKNERDLCSFVVSNRLRLLETVPSNGGDLRHYKAILVSNYKVNNVHILKTQIIQLMMCEGVENSLIKDFMCLSIPIFPMKGTDISKYVRGPNIAKNLRMLKDKWIAEDYKLDKEELLKYFKSQLNK